MYQRRSYRIPVDYNNHLLKTKLCIIGARFTRGHGRPSKSMTAYISNTYCVMAGCPPPWQRTLRASDEIVKRCVTTTYNMKENEGRKELTTKKKLNLLLFSWRKLYDVILRWPSKYRSLLFDCDWILQFRLYSATLQRDAVWQLSLLLLYCCYNFSSRIRLHNMFTINK